MSENIDELRNMLVTFRVSELQMLLGFAGRNKSGRKKELQQRALELLRVRSHPIHQKIRDLYKTIQQSGFLNSAQQQLLQAQQAAAGDTSPPPLQQQGTGGAAVPAVANNNKDSNNMPQNPVAGQGVQRGAAGTVHPYDSRQLQTRQQTMYTQNVYNPYPQYAQQQKTAQQQAQQQVQGNQMPANTYPIHPDVKFRRLPFYDILSDLLKPSTLVPQSNQRMQEAIFYFHLTPQQATDIASSRDIRPGVKCDYVKQVQLRFCLLETTCEQDDCFPPNVMVKVNNKPCPLPNPIPTNKPGVEPKRPPRPVNITPMVKLSPTVANTISVSWAPDFGRGYAMSVALVQKLTSGDLLDRLKKKGAKHSDHTRGLIKEKLKEDADSEITTTCLRVSLICPLGKMRMSTPCRAITCNHLQCFDSSLFLQMNERKPTWICPVCDKPALYDNLVIDGYFQEVLASASLPSDMNEIQLNKDGTWSSQTPEKRVAKAEKVPLDDSIEIIGDDIEIISSNTTTTATSSTDKQSKEDATSNNNNNNGSSSKQPPSAAQQQPTPLAASKEKVVDLTCSDSEDDEPLAKRRMVNNPKPDSTIKFSDTTSISSSSNQSRVTTTPGPSSVSSSGYPASPSIITLDSPSPPRSPQPPPTPTTTPHHQQQSSSSANQNQTQQGQQQQHQQSPQQQQQPSCIMQTTANQNGSVGGNHSNGSSNGSHGSHNNSNHSNQTTTTTPPSLFSPSMPYLDLENEATSAGNMGGYSGAY